MSRFKVPFVLLVALFLAGCANVSGSAPPTSGTRSDDSATAVDTSVAGSEGEKQLPSRSYEPSAPVIVTRDDPSLPAGCRPRQTAGLIMNFFEAFNRGDQERLSRFFVPYYPIPGLYGVSEDRGSRGFGTQSRDELLRYFAERHKQGERLQLLKVDVGKGWESGTANITFVITRKAGDLKPGLGGPDRVAMGKGGIDCKKQRIVVWQMGMEMPEYDKRIISPYYGSCKEPPGWKPGEAVIACARP